MTTDWSSFVDRGWRRGVIPMTVGPVFDVAEVLEAVQDALWGDPARYAPMARVYVDASPSTHLGDACGRVLDG